MALRVSAILLLLIVAVAALTTLRFAHDTTTVSLHLSAQASVISKQETTLRKKNRTEKHHKAQPKIQFGDLGKLVRRVQVSRNISDLYHVDLQPETGIPALPVQNNTHVRTITSDEKTSIEVLQNRTSKIPAKASASLLADKVQQMVNKYLGAADAGISHIDIVKRVFKAQFRDNSDVYLKTYPFMSGETVRAFADVDYYPRQKRGKYLLMTNKKSKWLGKDGEVIFVQTEYVQKFTEDLLPNITHKFILISHISDYSAPRGNTSELLSDPRLIAWFARNAFISDSHPHKHKLIPLPIGLRDSYLNKRFISVSSTSVLMENLRNLPPMYDGNESNPSASLRPNLVYLNFNMDHHYTRLIARNLLGDIGLDRTTRNLTQAQYFQDLRQSKFVASPEGYGLDCYRTWEAIAFGAIPIVRNSSLLPLYAASPALVINNWTKEEVNLQMLNDFKVSQRATRDVILAEYWFEIINSYRNK